MRFMVLAAVLPCSRVAPAAPQQMGSIRGVVHDRDFDAPLPAAEVMTVETGDKVLTSDQGNFVFAQVPPGTYTLVFSKDGYVRQVETNVVVSAGQLTDVSAALSGDFTEMDEFVVQDVLQLGAGTEAALLALRFESPALLDSISADLMSRAGASDAASALRLVAGATVQDGKSAVIRGLPDRYVSSQMNGVRLPTADEDKRAVELDQFPSPVIESIQVSKTFTPDQQGDASGGAVDVRLKGIPDENRIQVKTEYSYNSQSAFESDFLTYRGGGVDFLGFDDGGRDIQYDNIGQSWDGAVGVETDDAPIDYKWAIDAGGKRELDNGLELGGFLSVFYERDSSFFDDGVDDSYWVENPGDPLTPQTNQGTPSDGDFKTALFDVTQASETVQWGGLGTFGVASENHSLALSYLYTHTAEDKVTLAEDTRGKEYFFPGYDPDDPTGIGNDPSSLQAAPYLRLETLEYTERTTDTLQLRGEHTMGDGLRFLGVRFLEPEVDWTLALSSADLDQPDKRQFGTLWHPASFNPGVPPFIPPFTTPPTHFGYKPDANFNLGNLQRIWKEIEEKSFQTLADVTLPFEQWGGVEGYLEFGLFDDDLDRTFDQDTFSNFGDSGSTYIGDFDDLWSRVFPFENHPVTESLADVDYEGELDVSAVYGMVDLPLSTWLSVITGVRYETTDIGIVNFPEADALWVPPGATAPVTLGPGDADVDFSQEDWLPSIGVRVEAHEQVTVRASYSQTVARQTFKEITPILQQEFLGGPIFIGNPDLQMSSLDNFDLRVDYRPYEGSLVSGSVFYKDLEDPIEYVQRLASFAYTTPVNYPEGELYGVELEVRQDVGRLWDSAEGLSLGANATLIESEVQLPDDEIAGFVQPGIQTPITSRDATDAPEYLLNLYLIYDAAYTGTQVGVFYTLQGDTLIAGPGQANGNFIPAVYATEFDTLNVSVVQNLGRYLRLQLQAKNLTNPDIETVYRSDFTGDDVTRSSFTRGIDYSIALGVSFSF